MLAWLLIQLLLKVLYVLSCTFILKNGHEHLVGVKMYSKFIFVMSYQL